MGSCGLGLLHLQSYMQECQQSIFEQQPDYLKVNPTYGFWFGFLLNNGNWSVNSCHQPAKTK